jgi:hypothetical protein
MMDCQKNVKWTSHIGISNLLDMQLDPIQPLVKEFLHAIT